MGAGDFFVVMFTFRERKFREAQDITTDSGLLVFATLNSHISVLKFEDLP